MEEEEGCREEEGWRVEKGVEEWREEWRRGWEGDGGGRRVCEGGGGMGWTQYIT